MVSVQRVELYLDGRPRPLATLDRAPFKFQLDTGGLAAGGHALRLSILYADGSREERSHLFEVSAGEALALQDVGFLPGRGVITIDVSRELEPAGTEPSRRLVLGLVVFTLLLITLGVPVFMALGSAPVRQPVERAAPPPGGPTPAEAVAPPPVDGAALYLEHCASCHQPDGSGIAGVFSPLVGERVASADSVIVQVLRGGVAMPPFVALSDAAVAAVVTHVRTSWGNRFGAVSPEDVAARR